MKVAIAWHSAKGRRTEDNRDYSGVGLRSDSALGIVLDGSTATPDSGALARHIARNLVDWFVGASAEVTAEDITAQLRDIHARLATAFRADSASYVSTAEGKPATGRRNSLPPRGSGPDAGSLRAPWHARFPDSWRVPRRVGLKGQLGFLASGVGLGFSGAALGEPVAVTIHLEDCDVMGQPVEQRAGEALGAEGLRPLVER